MGYRAALAKAWSELENLGLEDKQSVRLLANEYEVDFKKREVFARASNVVAKDYLSILVLPYLTQRLKGLPSLTAEWISFKQLDGGLGYYPPFKERTLNPLLRKYGDRPEAIFELTERFCSRRAQLADASVALEVFEGVPVLITLSKADEEFGPEANILFDKSIKDIFCTEDVVVLAEFVAQNI